MKKDVHPKYYKTTMTCACGNVYPISSTSENLKVEICSACHPFFTGKTKLIDIAHRVHRFDRIREKSKTLKAAKKAKLSKKIAATKKDSPEKKKTEKSIKVQ